MSFLNPTDVFGEITTVPLDEDVAPLFNIWQMHRMSALLGVCVELNVCGWMKKEYPRGSTAKQLQEHFNFHSENVAEIFFTSLAGVGVFVQTGTEIPKKYKLSRMAELFLVPGSESFFGPFIQLSIPNFCTPGMLLNSLRTPRGEGSNLMMDLIQGNRATQFTMKMHSLAVCPSKTLAEKFDFSDSSCILDVGAGSGVYLMSCLRQNEHLTGMYFDLDPVAKVANTFAEDNQLEDRMTFVTGDFWNEELPSGADTILFVNIIHDWEQEKWDFLLQKAYRALPVGGKVLVVEMMLADSPATSSQASLLMNLAMAQWTDGVQPTPDQLFEVYHRNGFAQAQQMELSGGFSVAWAKKVMPSASSL